MRVIQLARKDTPEARARLIQALKDAYTDRANAALLKVLPHPDDEDDDVVEAVIVPYHVEFSALFELISKSSGTKKSAFDWNDHELEPLLGLGVMQVNFQDDTQLLLVDSKTKNQIVFAIVTKKFFEANA